MSIRVRSTLLTISPLLLTALGAGCGTSAMSDNGSGGNRTTGAGGATGLGGLPGAGGGGGSTVVVGGSGCPLFTADDAWNTDITNVPVDDAQTAKINTLVGTAKIHPDFGPGFGIPFNVVPQSQPPLPITFDGYPDESDPGPYPFPDVSVARIEGPDPRTCDGDCHLLTVQMGTCLLYEGYACHYTNGWVCSNGAKWDLRKKSYGQRPDGWTSVDAAGLPIYAGLARYEEVQAGEITHAIRFTLKCTAASEVPPATHHAVPGGCNPANGPPMGTRVRLADEPVSE